MTRRAPTVPWQEFLGIQGPWSRPKVSPTPCRCASGWASSAPLVGVGRGWRRGQGVSPLNKLFTRRGRQPQGHTVASTGKSGSSHPGKNSKESLQFRGLVSDSIPESSPPQSRLRSCARSCSRSLPEGQTALFYSVVLCDLPMCCTFPPS